MKIITDYDVIKVQADDLINDLPLICNQIHCFKDGTKFILHTNQEITPGNPYVLIDGEEVYASALSMFTEVYSQGRKVEI